MKTPHPLNAIAARWPEIEALLDEALALPPAQRLVWLQALHLRQPELRDTLAQLLRGHAQAETEDFLNTLPPLRNAAPLDSAAAGGLVGPWRLLAPLGSGGMGMVWLAERADGSVKRHVALKLPRVGWGSASAERMARERDILATLEHPHIARLYEASADEQGRPYLALEFVQGEPIDAWCAARALPVHQRLGLLLQVAEAVSHAHARLVVHRDLKPANILVTPDGQVRLLDFGIAKLLEGEHTQDTALTQVSGRAMTLDYASPEQIRGEPLSTASDLYSLGVVAFELLTGSRPYRLKRGSAAELEEAIESAEPPLASDVAAGAAAHATKKALLGDLDAILNRALKKRPQERYASVADFAQDIRRHLNQQPVLARPDSRAYRLRKFVARHRFGVAAGAALVLAVTVGTAVSAWQAAQAREQTRRAERALNDQAAVNSLYVDALTRLSSMAGEDATALARPHAVGRTLESVLQEHLKAVGDEPAQTQALLGSVALQLNYSSDFERSLDVGRQYLQNLKTHGGEPWRVIEAHTMLGRTLVQLGRLEEAETTRRAGVDWQAEAQDSRSLTSRLELLSDLGSLLGRRGKREEAETVLLRGAELAAARLPTHPQRVTVLSQLSTHFRGFDDARALAVAQQASGLVDGGVKVEPEVLGNVHEALGVALGQSGQSAAAELALQRAHAVQQGLYGRANRNVANDLGLLAATVARQGDVARAQRLLADEVQALATIDAPAARVASALLYTRQLEVDHLHGDSAALARRLAAGPPAAAMLVARDTESLAIEEAKALLLCGRAEQALARIAPLARDSAVQGQPTLRWFRVAQVLVAAQLAQGEKAVPAGHPGPAVAARDGALALLRLQREHRATASWAFVVSGELAALAAARSGDVATALRELSALEAAAAALPAPSSVEAAESAARRAEIWHRGSRPDKARSAAQSAQAWLQNQHPDSPRLTEVRTLLAALP